MNDTSEFEAHVINLLQLGEQKESELEAIGVANHVRDVSDIVTSSDFLSKLNLSRLEKLKADEKKQKHAKFLADKYIPERLERYGSEFLTVRPEFLTQLGIPKKRYLTRTELDNYNFKHGKKKSHHQVKLSSKQRAELIEYCYPGTFDFNFEPVSFRHRSGRKCQHSSRLILQIKGKNKNN